ncbi:MAG: hypothetical protein P9M14_11840 [Candidatus Alcyoniella australis]|nr:hypothetical protein [Candidatus Alcyoniella australis]
MKQSPQLDEVQRKMQPGRIVINGMLGHDQRPLVEILTADQGRVNALDLSHEQIADFLSNLLEIGRDGLGDPIHAGQLVVQVEHFRGRTPCPWADGVFPKVLMRLRHEPSARAMQVSALGIHMIHVHGFYQGRGSQYRVEPELIAELMAQSER